MISFIIPAYNASAFIADAIRSVIAQTYADWELIIIDDASSDDTLRIAQDFANSDSRIRVVGMECGSGSAFRPRYEGLLRARGEYILPLDADDLIPPDYAEALLEVAAHADTVTDRLLIYPAERVCDASGDTSSAIRPEYFDPRPEITCRPGRDAVILTLDGWRVGANGGLIPRSLYLEAYREYGPEQGSFIHADEILTRYLMAATDEVTFTDKAIYYYRRNPASITAAPTLRRLDILDATKLLIEFTRRRFGEQSEEYRRSHQQMFHWIFDSLQLLSHPAFSRAQRREGYRRIREGRDLIDRALIRRHASKKLLLLLPLPLPLLRQILRLRYLIPHRRKK